MRRSNRTHLASAFAGLALAACGPQMQPDGGADTTTPPVDTPRPPGPDGMTPPMDVVNPPMDVVTPPMDVVNPPMDVVTPPPDTPMPMTDTCRGPAETATLADPRLCLVRFADNVAGARGLAIAPNGDVFVESGGSIRVLYDANNDGSSSAAERSTWGSAPGLNHSVVFNRDYSYVYASSANNVYRWRYTMGQRMAMGGPETVLRDIPSASHSVRSLAFDSMGRLYVSVGSHTNIDSSVGQRALIRRFTLPATVPAGGIMFSTGELWASGLRNETALTVDSMDRVWGAENGVDDLGDDSPAEEVNRLDGPGARFFGYPQCYSQGVPGGGPTGPQRADRRSDVSPQRDDAWCASAANNHPPVFGLQGHWAPLGIVEYTGAALPAEWRGDLFVTAHGSWNHSMGVGRLVARLDVQADGTIRNVTPIVSRIGGGAAMSAWQRPVDVQAGREGALYFTTDQPNGRVYRIGYR